MTPRKDPLTAIESTAILVARGHDLHLDLVGGELTESDKGYLRTVEDEIRLGSLEGRVQRAGSVPYREIPAYYRRACIVVNASLTGSLDKVVLEAMAMGRPVVTCNEAALPLFAELGDAAEMLAFEPDAAPASSSCSVYTSRARRDRWLSARDRRATTRWTRSCGASCTRWASPRHPRNETPSHVRGRSDAPPGARRRDRRSVAGAAVAAAPPPPAGGVDCRGGRPLRIRGSTLREVRA
jgi:hypothetical protein